MNVISCTTGVKQEVAAANPSKVESSPKELQDIIQQTQTNLNELENESDEDETSSDETKKNAATSESTLKTDEFDFDKYDDECGDMHWNFHNTANFEKDGKDPFITSEDNDNDSEKEVNIIKFYNNILTHKDKVKQCERKLIAFFTEHKIAFHTANHLISLLKDICIKPEVVHDMSLSGSKCAHIIENILAKRETEKLIQILKTQKFSILIDESTDITDTKFMCLLVRYFSRVDKTIKTQLLELLALNASDCCAVKCYQCFKDFMLKEKIPITNIIGMASDNAPVMTGDHNSFFSYLKSDVPNVISLNCICHSFAIISSRACAELPSNCENLIRAVATYTSGSAKRCIILKQFQEYFEVEKKKILQPCKTSWLVLHKCIVRLLDDWNALKNYFILAVAEDKLKSAEDILTWLNDDEIKAILLFLKYSLLFLNNFNRLFQSQKILIHKLYALSNQFIIQLSQNVIISEALSNIDTLDVNEENNFKDLSDIYVGPECEGFLKTQCSEFALKIKSQCLNFYKTAIKEIMARLPYKDPFFQKLNFLDPKIALYIENRTIQDDLSLVAAKLGNVDKTCLAFEWRILPTVFSDDKKKELSLLDVDKMWEKILNFKNFEDEKMFPNLELLVETILSLPHSNAEAEHIFSIVTDVKTKMHNKLSNNTISAICKIRSYFHCENINCTNFKVDSRHLELYNAQNV